MMRIMCSTSEDSSDVFNPSLWLHTNPFSLLPVVSGASTPRPLHKGVCNSEIKKGDITSCRPAPDCQPYTAKLKAEGIGCIYIYHLVAVEVGGGEVGVADGLDFEHAVEVRQLVKLGGKRRECRLS